MISTRTEYVIIQVTTTVIIITSVYAMVSQGADIHKPDHCSNVHIHRTRSLTKSESKSIMVIKRVSRVSNSHGKLEKMVHGRAKHIGRNRKNQKIRVEGTEHDIKIENLQKTEIEGDSVGIQCPNNYCVFTPCLNFRGRSLEGRLEFGYKRNSFVSGKASLIYKNLQTGMEKCFGFEIIIKYETGKEATIKLEVFYGKNGEKKTNGIKVTTMLIPDIHKPAPPFTGSAVVEGQFKEVSLSMFQSKYLVLLFYPLDFTFVCPTELIAYSDRLNEFRECDCEVVAVSTDSEYCHLAWANVPKEDGGLAGVRVPLLSDKSTKISRDYGVLDEETGVAFRGLFIIDDRGLVRQVTINDLQVGRSVDETLRLVQAFRHVDKYGEVCPAGWRPGNPAIAVEENRRSSTKSKENSLNAALGEGIEGAQRNSRSSSQQSSRTIELSGSLN